MLPQPAQESWQAPALQNSPAPQLTQAQGLATQAPLTQLSQPPQTLPVQASAGGQTRWQVVPAAQVLRVFPRP